MLAGTWSIDSKKNTWLVRVESFRCLVCCNIVSKTHSQNWSAGKPSIRKPASSEIISDSALLWQTVVCFLHIHEIGTHVCTSRRWLESRKSLANEASWNKPSSQSSVLFPRMTELPVAFGLSDTIDVPKQSFVASLVPCCYWPCHSIYWPQ